MKTTSSEKKKHTRNAEGIERRDFIKLGATGVVTSLAACAVPTSLKVGEGEQVTAKPAVDPAVAGPPTIPEVGDLIDPGLASSESWQEPWTWRPDLWPDDRLNLTLVRNQNPGGSASHGSQAKTLFSYAGISPGPTVRVRNDDTLRIRVRNTLGLNRNETQIEPAPDPVEFPNDVRMQICALVEEQVLGGDPENPRRCPVFFYPEQMLQVVKPETRPGWNLGGHLNGQHAAHTTNLHTHGLHVFPDNNPDGSYSDNIFQRIIPREDFEARQSQPGAAAEVLAEHEHVAQLDYKLQLSFEHKGERFAHPPGTHWYHPHAHGSTHDQVASGMAGFLLVEGDVDDAINSAMTGKPRPDPETRTGPFDFRERLIFIQRVFVISFDPDAGVNKSKQRFPQPISVNGTRAPAFFRMRPGAVERWRVLNGSVDGAGTKRFMVLDGQFVQRDERIWRVVTQTTGEGKEAVRKRRLEPVSEQDLEDAKLDIQQLSFDGITLVVEENGQAKHKIRDLSRQNANTQNPFAAKRKPGEDELKARLRAFESVFRDGDSLRRSFVRPNEVYLTNANRTDLFFKAPTDSAGRVFTIFAKEAHIHNDNFQFTLQKRIKDPEEQPFRRLFNVIAGYIHVKGKPVEGGDFDIQDLNRHLPPVPPLLQPITEQELEVPGKEARVTGVATGSKRTRTISYSGTGGADFPTIKVPPGYAEKNHRYENILWATVDGTRVLMPNLTRTMAINPEFDLSANPDPDLPRKFAPHDPKRPRMLVDTAEEWVVYNSSQMLWSHTDRERFPQPGSYREHYISYPISRAEGQKRFANDPEFRISVKGTDHPFHIHVNPMWVLRIDVPDENGNLHNVLPEPCWMDTVAVPRAGGRVVFRTRFDDFTGKWINHCHILLHEDMGMMQEVECTDQAGETNYQTRQQAASHAMPARQVDAIYPPPSLQLRYRQNLSFMDPNKLGFQHYPGFELTIPELDDTQEQE